MSVPSSVSYADDDSGFHRELHRRVDAYFEENDLTRKATWPFILNAVFVLAVMFGSYGMIVSGQFGGWTLFGLQLLNGLFMFIGTLTIAHDATHNAFSEKEWVNKALSYVFDLCGINSYIWDFNHMRSHHAGPNVPEYDAAIDCFGVFRLHPKGEWNPIQRYQHWYILLIYGVSTLFKWFYLDYYTLTRKQVGGVEIEDHDPKETVILFASKAFLYLYAIVIPLMVVPVPWYQYMAGFLAYHFMGGMIIAFVFQVTHLSERTEFIEPDEDGQLPDSFAVHTFKVTADYSTDSPLARWIGGGLNMHVAHHLFPDICQVHLPDITDICRETAEEYGVPYKAYPSALSAFGSHLRLLKKLGEQEEFEPNPEGRVRPLPAGE
ncbi:MAG: fatty acid desaturase [Bradymonadaceae bacterium]